MNRDDAEEYTQALGQVVAGGWRQVALGKRLGVPTALGITTEEWVNDRLGGYVRLSLPDRREAVAELTEEGMSTREIGDVLGVDHSTVVRDQASGADAPDDSESVAADEGNDGQSGADAPELPPDPTVRRTRALRILASAVSAASTVTAEIDDVADAVMHGDRSRHAADVRRSIETWERLAALIETQSLRRVK